jgi:hypothetical protein
MSQYYPIPQPTIAANILVRRERRLPLPGEVHVRAGQRVEPSDTVASTTLAGEQVRVDIASDLALSPASVLRRLRISPGQPVEADEVLASRGGVGSRESRSPVAGTFTGYDTASGIGTITTPSEPVSVQAHLKGIVTDLIPYYGATIETPATLIRGIFGVGGEQHGVLKVLATNHDEPMTAEMIDARVTYAVVLGGSEIPADALRRLVELGARGIIIGSIRASELADFMGQGHGGQGAWRLGAATQGSNSWTFPPPNPHTPLPIPRDFALIVTEGFGATPMTIRTFETLASHDGQEIAVDATTVLRGGLARPEIIIPLPRTAAVQFLDEGGPRLEVGKTVRVLSPAYLGQTAQVVALPNGPRPTQSGVISPVADIQLPSGHPLRIPLANLEAIE